MENMLWELIKTLVMVYFIYIFILSFTVSTVVYLTYRFWKMVLPKHESNVFIANAPMVWYRHNFEEEE